MHPNERFRSAVRGFYLWLGSIVVLGGAPIVARTLLERDTTTARAAAVVIGVAGTLPLMWVVALMIRRGDEFNRRMHYTALAYAFPVTVVLVLTLHWLVRAGFIGPPDLIVVWVAALLIWLATLIVVKYAFERVR